jgi:hypothetical protein
MLDGTVMGGNMMCPQQARRMKHSRGSDLGTGTPLLCSVLQTVHGGVVCRYEQHEDPKVLVQLRAQPMDHLVWCKEDILVGAADADLIFFHASPGRVLHQVLDAHSSKITALTCGSCHAFAGEPMVISGSRNSVRMWKADMQSLGRFP